MATRADDLQIACLASPGFRNMATLVQASKSTQQTAQKYTFVACQSSSIFSGTMAITRFKLARWSVITVL
jgi:hypothetical protein